MVSPMSSPGTRIVGATTRNGKRRVDIAMRTAEPTGDSPSNRSATRVRTLRWASPSKQRALWWSMPPSMSPKLFAGLTIVLIRNRLIRRETCRSGNRLPDDNDIMIMLPT